MCYAKPGPRCSNHALKTLNNARKAWAEANTDTARSIAMKNLKEAEEQYDTTPAGQRSLIDIWLATGDPDGLYSARLEHGIIKRAQMLESIGTEDSGDIDDNDSPSIISPNGDRRWYINGKLNREDDKPAIEYSDGTKEWWTNGELHREGDKPARVGANGTKEWYLNGKCHRGDDKPAIEFVNGDKEWRVNGKLHRESDKPAFEGHMGNREWWVNGKLHREDDKPAIERVDGSKEWWVNGKLRRLYGCA